MPRRTGLASDSEVKSTKSSSFVSFTQAAASKCAPDLRWIFPPQKRSTLNVCLPTSNGSIKKNSLTGCLFIPDTVRLTPKNSHQKYRTTHHLRLTLFICMTECEAGIPLEVAKVYYNVYSLSHSKYKVRHTSLMC